MTTYQLHVFVVPKSAGGASLPAARQKADLLAAGETTEHARTDARAKLAAAGHGRVRSLSFGPSDTMVAYVEE